MRIARGSVVGLAGLVGAGVLAWPAVGSAAPSDEVYLKRQETDVELVAFDDEDDDDTVAKKLQRDTRSKDTRSKATRSKDTRSRVTQQSRSKQASRDATNSRASRVSRDRDVSRGDLTRDWTRDGGKQKRDWSSGSTNDWSRNDTRWGNR